MRLSASCIVVLLLLSGCRRATPEVQDQSPAVSVEESVRTLASTIAGDLASAGPTAWLDHFENSPAFFMASDGRLLFPTIDSARTMVEGFAPGIAHMELVWDEIRVDPLNDDDDMAVMAASYHEVLTDTAGGELRFGGYFTGLVVQTASGWKLRHAHWSSPAPTP